MAGEKPKEAPKESEKRLDGLRTEVKEGLAFQTVAEDSQSYELAAAAVEKLLARSIDAAGAALAEIEKQKALPDKHPTKMSAGAIRNYEDMVTQVESWAILMPVILQQARAAQINPGVRSILREVFEMILDQDKFVAEVEKARLAVLKGSNLNPESPFAPGVPESLRKLTAIATVSWMIRHKLDMHPDILNQPALQWAFQNAKQELVDQEIGATWKAEKTAPIRTLIADRFATHFGAGGDKARAEQRAQALIALFSSGRVEVNGEVVLNPEQKVAEGSTVQVRSTYDAKTKKAGETLDTASAVTDKVRSNQAETRGTQGFPGAEKIAYDFTLSMTAWKRLLLDAKSGSPDRVRYARQLGDSVRHFHTDFVAGGELEEFVRIAGTQLEAAKKSNKRAEMMVKFWAWITGAKDYIAERLTTPAEELQKIHDDIVTKVREEFKAFMTPEADTTCKELMIMLAAAEAGNAIDEKRLLELLDSFAQIQRKTGNVLIAFQAWQLSENADRVGGIAVPNLLEQATRIDAKSMSGYLSTFAPYGSFSTRLYRDQQDRLQLIDPIPKERGVLYHPWETGKMVAGPIVVGLGTGLTAGLVLRILGLVSLTKMAANPFLQALAVAAGAEHIMMQTKELAKVPMIKVVSDDIAQRVENLGKIRDDKTIPVHLKMKAARESAQFIRSDVVTILSVASRLADIKQILPGTVSDRSYRPDFELEAHIFTNELLGTIGYPPLSELKGSTPKNAEQLEEALKKINVKDLKISPEIHAYFAMQQGAKKEVTREMEYKLQMLQGKVTKPVAEQILDGDAYPSLRTGFSPVPFLRDAANDPALQKREWPKTPEKQQELQKMIADTLRTYTAIIARKQKEVRGEMGLGGFFSSPLSQQIQMSRLVHKDYRDSLNARERELEDARVRAVVRVPMNKVLWAYKALETNPPSIEQMEAWMPENKGLFTDTSPARAGDAFLVAWAQLRSYADRYVPPSRSYDDAEALKWSMHDQGYRLLVSLSDDKKTQYEVLMNSSVGQTYLTAAGSKPPPIPSGFTLRVPRAPAEWKGDTWEVSSASFFDDASIPKEVRDLAKKVAQTPVEDNSSVFSVRILLSMFPFSREVINGSFADDIMRMYRESYRKEMVLFGLEAYCDAYLKQSKTGVLSPKDAADILAKMREMQQEGSFAFAPKNVVR